MPPPQSLHASVFAAAGMLVIAGLMTLPPRVQADPPPAGYCCLTQGQSCTGNITNEDCADQGGNFWIEDQLQCNVACGLQLSSSSASSASSVSSSLSSSSSAGCGGNVNAFCGVFAQGGGCVTVTSCGAGQTAQTMSPATSCSDGACNSQCKVCVAAVSSSSSTSSSSSSRSSSSRSAWPTCGNGWLDAGETCDDRNLANNDGCDAQCRTEAGYMCTMQGEDCVDSDGGDNPYVRGVVTPADLRFGNGEDICVTQAPGAAPMLQEWVCTAGKPVLRACDPGRTCVAGFCATTAEALAAQMQCEDSDAGINIFVKGTLTKASSTPLSDFCTDQDQKPVPTSRFGVDYYCIGNTFTTSGFTCPSGTLCQNGACK